MPTSRPRHVLTETDALESALLRARARWPEDRDRPTRLLLHLIETGDAALQEGDEDRRKRRAAALDATSGAFTGMYPAGYLEGLRQEWPE